MSLNWKEIDLVLHELNLPGMQIQKVYQSAFDLLAMELYDRSKSCTRTSETTGVNRRSFLFLISISPLACRIHESFQPVPKSEKPLRFAEFLKSRILNGHIQEAVQLGDNRIVRIIIKRGENVYRLYIRLWSNAANVIVTDTEGTILDAMKRLPRRGETSGRIYSPESLFEQQESSRTKNYEIRNLPGEGSFNSRVDAWYAEHGGKLSLEQLREEVQRFTGKNRNRLETGLERLREKEADYAEGERYKQYGDLILSNAASLAKGDSWLETTTHTEPGVKIRIELDPKKTPAENAAHYYEKYRKAKNGLEDLREEIAKCEQGLARLSETEKQLLEETSPLRLEALLKKLKSQPDSASSLRSPLSKKPARPGLTFAIDGWIILVGRDAAENDELLRRHVKGNDLWLHVRDWAGSYVFIKNRPGKTVPLEILLDAGNLALHYSKGKSNGRGDLYYTQVKYLRRAKNGPKGMVIPTQEKNLFITLEKKRLKKLETERLYY